VYGALFRDSVTESGRVFPYLFFLNLSGSLPLAVRSTRNFSGSAWVGTFPKRSSNFSFKLVESVSPHDFLGIVEVCFFIESYCRRAMPPDDINVLGQSIFFSFASGSCFRSVQRRTAWSTMALSAISRKRFWLRSQPKILIHSHSV